MPPYEYGDLVRRSRLRRRIKTYIVAGIVISVVILLSFGIYHEHSAENKVSVSLTYFTDTVIRNSTVIEVPAMNYSAFTTTLHYDSLFQGSFHSSVNIVMYVLTLNEFQAFAAREIFGYLYSTGLVNSSYFSISLIPGTYYIVFSDMASGISATVILTSPFLVSYFL
ncbi:MAG: hypothetical protein QW100_00925 [Thermoplasmatales archaeon]